MTIAARLGLVLAITAVGALLPGASLAEDRVVRVWHTETEPQTIQAVNDIARRFEAKSPGIKIEAEGLGWAELEGKIMASLAAGNPPELSHGQPITCTSLQSKGLLNPLDDVVKSIGEANIWEQVKRVCNVDGKQFGLVHAAGTSLLIYRKDMADKAGLKVIFSSGYSSEFGTEASPLDEQFGFLEKPYKPEVLVRAVRDCLDR